MEKEVGYDVVRLMESIKEAHNSKAFRDIMYLGTIHYQDMDDGALYTAEKDIFVLVEEREGVFTYHYYDENEDLIAVDLGDSQGILANKDFFADRNLDFAKEITNGISSLDREDSLSLEDLSRELDEYARVLGISRKQILEASTVELDKTIEELQNKEKEDDSVRLKQEDENAEENTLISAATKAEVNLDTMVNGKQKLGQILGIQGGGKLIAVYSKDIVNNQNTAEFRFLVKRPDGTLENAEMLTQKDGNRPNRDIAAINRDGSKVEEQQVNSMFMIDSTSNTQDFLSIRRGSLGVLEVSYGQIDSTNNEQGQTIPLKTDHMYPVTSEVRREMDPYKGTRNIKENMDEYKMHKEAGCDDITLEEANGEEDGHEHLTDNDAQIDACVQELMENNIIDDNYYPKEVKESLLKTAESHPEWTLEELKAAVEHDLVVNAPIQERY